MTDPFWSEKVGLGCDDYRFEASVYEIDEDLLRVTPPEGFNRLGEFLLLVE